MRPCNFHTGMLFFTKLSVYLTFNLTYAYDMQMHANPMSLSCELWWNILHHGTISVWCNANFHKAPLRLPYALCTWLAISTRHPHDQSERYTTPVRLLLDPADSHKRRRPSVELPLGFRSWCLGVIYCHNLIVTNRSINCTVFIKMCTY